MGSFSGFSFPQLNDACLRLLRLTLTTLGRKVKGPFVSLLSCLKLVMLLACLLLVTLQALVCISKFASRPVGTMVFFKGISSVSKPSLTLCVTKRLCQTRYRGMDPGFEAYCLYFSGGRTAKNQSRRHQFWGDALDLSASVASIQVPTAGSKKSRWKDFWTDQSPDNETDELFSRIVAPFLKNNYQFCSSLDLEKLGEIASLRFGVKADVQFSIHRSGQFSHKVFTNEKSALHMSNLHRIAQGSKPKFEDVTYQLELGYYIQNDQLCQDAQQYDVCIQEVARSGSVAEAGCQLLIFQRKNSSQHDKVKVCDNENEEKMALAAYRKRFLKQSYNDEALCRDPCNSVTAHIRQVAAVRSKRSTPLNYVTILMPQAVRVYETFEAYPFITLVAEVGSWVGLFLGWCILDIDSYCWDAVKKMTRKKKASTIMKNCVCVFGRLFSFLLTGFCICCVLWQCVVCIEKVQSEPTTTKVFYEAMSAVPQPVFTVCQIGHYSSRLNRYYAVSQAQRGHRTALTLKKLVDRVEEQHEENLTWTTIWDPDNRTDGSVFVSPKINEYSYHFCQTIRLPRWTRGKVRFFFDEFKGVNIFIHNDGQYFKDSFSSHVRLARPGIYDSYLITLAHYRLKPTSRFSCTKEEGWMNPFDKCLEDLGKKRIMERVGCLPPLFENATNICPNKTFALKGMAAYNDLMINDYKGIKGKI